MQAVSGGALARTCTRGERDGIHAPCTVRQWLSFDDQAFVLMLASLRDRWLLVVWVRVFQRTRKHVPGAVVRVTEGSGERQVGMVIYVPGSLSLV